MIVGAAAAAVWLWRGTAREGEIATGGPIVLISIDTLRADRLPVYDDYRKMLDKEAFDAFFNEMDQMASSADDIANAIHREIETSRVR